MIYDEPEHYSPAEIRQRLSRAAADLAQLDADPPQDLRERWYYLTARQAQLTLLEDLAGLLVETYDAADDPGAGSAAEELREHYSAALAAAEQAVETARPAEIARVSRHG